MSFSPLMMLLSGGAGQILTVVIKFFNNLANSCCSSTAHHSVLQEMAQADLQFLTISTALLLKLLNSSKSRQDFPLACNQWSSEVGWKLAIATPETLMI